MGNNVLVDAWQAVLANTRLIGANKVNELRLGVNRMVSQNIQQRANTVNVVQRNSASRTSTRPSRSSGASRSSSSPASPPLGNAMIVRSSTTTLPSR